MATVLVVDDEPGVRALLEEVIVDEGQTPTLARDGQEALSLIDDGLRPQLVIADIRMPRLSGIELAAALHARYRSAPPPIALMSADHQWLDDVEGVVAKLPKPFSPDAIAELVNQHCEVPPGGT